MWVTFLGCASLLVPSPALASPLRLGLMDSKLEYGQSSSDLATGVQRARAAGASMWRFQIAWNLVAPDRPATSGDATDPDWPGYRWTQTDRMVREIGSAGLEPLPFVVLAPRWAEGPGRPSTKIAPTGTWKPDPRAFQEFAAALASRYSGRHPDPMRPGAALPRVGTWQAWNEPNLTADLSPQWTKSGKTWRPSSPGQYRALLNGFYAGVKEGDPSARVLSAATAPFGDLTVPGDRIPPARFWRDLLCVRGSSTPRAHKCPRINFDAYAHNPYPIGPPSRKARNRDDVSVPDLGKIRRIVDAATRRGTIAPKGSKALWVTEVSWDSAPDPDGLTLDEQAAYLVGALTLFQKQGASVVIWFNLRDQVPTPSYDSTYQSGLYMAGATLGADTPKPSLTAFRFPFSAYRTRGVAQLWGLAPAPGRPVQIQARKATGWQTILQIAPEATREFRQRLRVGRGTELRAVQGNEVSLSWRAS